MSLVVTPKQLLHRAELYQQLNQLLIAGIPVISALQSVRSHPPSHGYGKPLGHILKDLGEGSTLTEAVQAVGTWMPSFDIALVHAGEKSGRLPNVFKLLGDYYQERASLGRQAISALLYPAFLLHFAVFIFPFPTLFQTGDLGGYVWQISSILLPLYLVVFVLIYAAQGRHGEGWRSLLERILRFVPLVGKARSSLALARLSAALEGLINAGVPIIQAWELAAGASGSPALRRAVLGWRDEVSAGQTPAEVVRTRRIFPEFFSSLYHTGEISGKLDDSLNRLRVHYQEDASHKLKQLSEWTPKLIYLVIMLTIAWRIISFYTGYFKQINDAINF